MKSVTCNRNTLHCSDYVADTTAQSDSWVSTYALRDQKTSVRFPEKTRYSSLLQVSKPLLGPNQPTIQGILFLRGHKSPSPKPTIHLHLAHTSECVDLCLHLPPYTFGTRCLVSSGLVTDGLNCRRKNEHWLRLVANPHPEATSWGRGQNAFILPHPSKELKDIHPALP